MSRGKVRVMIGLAGGGMSVLRKRFMKALHWLLVVHFVITAAALRAEELQVYFGTGGPGADGIYRARFDTVNGRLSKAERATEVESPGFLALHPDGDKIYAVAGFEGGPGVAGYRIGKDGGLESINRAPTGDGGGAHVSVHPSGRFLLTAQYGGGSVALFPLDRDGQLGKAQLSRHEGGSHVIKKRQESPHPHYCGFSPDGKFALVPDLGLDKVVIYKVDANAPSIEPHGFAEALPGAGPRHLKFSEDGKFIYLLNELSLSVTTFAWDAGAGTARRMGTVPALSEEAKSKETFNSAAEIVIHPGGRFGYSSNRGNDTVTAYRVDQAVGALDVIQVQPVRGAFPRNINLTPCGGWLLAAGADSNTISVHRVNPETGMLTYQTKSVINVPAPICILFAKSP
jgi:6-phosphogluconolactonase